MIGLRHKLLFEHGVDRNYHWTCFKNTTLNQVLTVPITVTWVWHHLRLSVDCPNECHVSMTFDYNQALTVPITITWVWHFTLQSNVDCSHNCHVSMAFHFTIKRWLSPITVTWIWHRTLRSSVDCPHNCHVSMTLLFFYQVLTVLNTVTRVWPHSPRLSVDCSHNCHVSMTSRVGGWICKIGLKGITCKVLARWKNVFLNFYKKSSKKIEEKELIFLIYVSRTDTTTLWCLHLWIHRRSKWSWWRYIVYFFFCSTLLALFLLLFLRGIRGWVLLFCNLHNLV